MMRRFLQILLTLGCLALDAGEIERLEAFPETINLTSKRSQAQLVITGWLPNGEPRDLTREAKVTSSNLQVATVSNAIVIPSSDGECQITIESGSHTLRIAVTVSKQTEPDPIRFNTEIQAALTKQGCNAGSCHGSPQGKAGFSLSLFGFDPTHDQRTLVREGQNRRLNVLAPDESLMLKKPLLRIPHVGGKKLRRTDTAYQILRQWIYEGAQPDPPNSPRCTGIIVHPGPDRLLRAPHLQQQLSVQAVFSDGSRRDITDIVTYETSNRPVATVNENGLVKGAERGLTAITIRYLQHLESVYFTVVHDNPEFVWTAPQEHNYVDQLVNERLQLLQISAAKTCSDSVFLRRVFLDLTGLLPTADQAHDFLASKDSEKRRQFIDRLLESREFSRFQSLQMADLFRVTPKTLTDGRAALFANWISKAIKQNRPFDQVTRDLLTATGDSNKVPPANYYAALDTTESTIETTAQIFMGSRIQCAKCHNHPFENWTQDDYYQIGAVFNRIQRDEGVIKMSDSGEMEHPRTGKIMKPWGGGTNEDRRSKFADWLTAPENPFFARVIVNRIWAHLLGKGIVEPIDDFRSSNPPSNAPLLDALAVDLVSNNFDRLHIFRVICNSQVYQRRTQVNEFNADDADNFSHSKVRLLSAEQLNDAIAYVTKSVPTTDEIPLAIEKLKRKETALASETDSMLTHWKGKAETTLQSLDFWEGSQWSTPFFPAESVEEAYAKWSVEEDLIATDSSATKWTQHTEWKNGQQIQFNEQEIGARYLYQQIWVQTAGELTFHFRASNGVQARCNGETFFDQKKIGRDAKTRNGTAKVNPGLNHFLFKTINGGGNFHFTARISELHGIPFKETNRSEWPGFVNDLIVRPINAQTTSEQDRLRDFHQSINEELTELREQLVKQDLLLATQRPWPEQTSFLKAFGQPKRISPCACERSGEPTLEQALQILNGQHVFQQINTSEKAYTALEDGQLIKTLYLAAYSRFPNQEEIRKTRAYINNAVSRKEAIQDIIWALVNTQEFMFQH
jgi:hypothetical protein